jgi:hypothetical protein
MSFKTNISIPYTLLLRIAKYCERRHIKRSVAIRELLEKGLDSVE